MKTALVVGRSKDVWKEIAAAQQLGTFDLVLVTGPTAVDYPDDIDHWVWFHSELFPHYAGLRAANGFTPAKEHWGVRVGKVRQPSKTFAIKHFIWEKGGSSGLAATMLALNELKVDRVVLAGVPMTSTGGQYDTNKSWPEAVHHQQAWVKVAPQLRGLVRSFSGWTKDLLGDLPTAEWLGARVAA